MGRFAADAYQYEVVENWAKLPSGITIGTNAPVTDSQDRVYVHNRSPHPLVVFDRDGNVIDYLGEDTLLTGMAHGAFIDQDDKLYLPRCDRHVVLKIDRTGDRLQLLGELDMPSDTGVTRHAELPREAAGPFNYPTDVAVAPSGEVYVSDGYGNSRIHCFGRDGELIGSWGEPGKTLPGQFHVPHCVWVHTDGRVFVADRENDRIQIFGPDGQFLDQWRGLAKPCDIYIDADETVYVAELNGFVRILTIDGSQITTLNDPHATGNNDGAHAIWVDSRGDLYLNIHQPGRELVKYRRVRDQDASTA